MGNRRTRRKCQHRDTSTGRPCQNYADSCPYIEHRRLVPAEAGGPEGDQDNSARQAAMESYVSRTADNLRIAQQGEARSLPPELKNELNGLVVKDTNLNTVQSEKDYWLHAALYRFNQRGIGIGCGIARRALSDRRGLFRRRHPPMTIHDVLFAGGTALVSQWGMSERFSEDIDLIIVSRGNALGHKRTTEMSKVVADVFADAVTDRTEHEWVPDSRNTHPMQIQAYGARSGDLVYAKVDINESSSDLSPWEQRPVMSMMGRYASDDMRREFPELGGFSLPSLHFTVTIGNKMRANVDNVDRGRLGKLTERARDLFDIASAASQDEARDEIIDHMRMCVVNAETRNDAVGQRARAVTRFPDSAALRSGTPENDALRHGYQYVIDTLAWRPSEAPSFDTAIEIARSLRPADV